MGDYVNFQHELRENWSVRGKLFELEEAFYGVWRMERLNSVFLGFGRGNLLCGTKCF